MSAIPIVHLHGSLGDLAGRHYLPELTADAVRLSADQIRVVHEEITGLYETALALLNSAEMICVFGVRVQSR